jgi:hypothetical protein
MPTRASRNSLDSYTACEPSASGHSEADRREQLMVDNGLVDGQATSRREILVLHASKPSRATSSGVDRTTLSNFCPDPGKPVYRAWCCPDVLVRHEAAMVDYQRALRLLRRFVTDGSRWTSASDRVISITSITGRSRGLIPSTKRGHWS